MKEKTLKHFFEMDATKLKHSLIDHNYTPHIVTEDSLSLQLRGYPKFGNTSFLFQPRDKLKLVQFDRTEWCNDFIPQSYSMYRKNNGVLIYEDSFTKPHIKEWMEENNISRPMSKS